ncbi:MAG: STAS domain-containing protein [Terriglobia bacterium]|jgi:anti-anti-sigma factor
MDLREEKNGKFLVLGLSGKLDAEGTKMFGERMTQFLDGGERYILLDFTDITYINSSGLHALILVERRLASSRGMLILAGVSDHIQKVLKISGLSSILTRQPTKAEALASFANGSI